MNLSPREKDKLLISMAAMVARRRLERGVKLNHPEAVALITDEVIEAGRAGRSFEEAEAIGYSVLGEDDVLEGVADMVTRLHVEPLFEDGTQMVTLHFPIKSGAA